MELEGEFAADVGSSDEDLLDLDYDFNDVNVEINFAVEVKHFDLPMLEMVLSNIKNDNILGLNEQLKAEVININKEDLLHEIAWVDHCIQIKSSASQTRGNAWQLYSNMVLQHMYHPRIPSWVLITVSRHALQALLDDIFKNTHSEKDVQVEITDEDKDIIQYLAGFVIHRIKRKIMHLQDSDSKADQMMLIDAVSRPADEPETSKLIRTKQRGGLMSVAEEIVPLFTKLEIILRQHLKLDEVVSQMSVNAIASQIFCDERVVGIFESLVSFVDVSQELKNKMMSDIVSTYIKTRISGYCRQQMQRMARRMKSAKKQRSLRASLH